MIRLFTALRKAILKDFLDVTVFQKAKDGFTHYGAECPGCGASGKLNNYGAYFRFIISYQENKVLATRVSVPRYKCASCVTTHGLLPGNLIPHSSYSLHFKLAVLLAYYERKTTVVKVCERFGIAVSTLYAWKALLRDHQELYLGALASKKKPALAFLHELFNSASLSERLQGFLKLHAFSFLQNWRAKTTRSLPP